MVLSSKKREIQSNRVRIIAVFRRLASNRPLLIYLTAFKQNEREILERRDHGSDCWTLGREWSTFQTVKPTGQGRITGKGF